MSYHNWIILACTIAALTLIGAGTVLWWSWHGIRWCVQRATTKRQIETVNDCAKIIGADIASLPIVRPQPSNDQ